MYYSADTKIRVGAYAPDTNLQQKWYEKQA